MKSGIYKITNISNNKVYIGSSKDYKQRLRQHKNQLKSNKHGNNHLQSSYNKYGNNNFLYELIEEVEIDLLIEKEIFYVKYYNCLNPIYGYNKASEIKNTSGYKWSLESRIKLSKSKKGKTMHLDTQTALITANRNRVYNPSPLKGIKVSQEIIEIRAKSYLQYDLEGNFIKEFKTAKLAAEAIKGTSKGIQSCGTGERMTYLNYQWFKKPLNSYPVKIRRYVRKHSKENYKEFMRLCSVMDIEKQDELLENPEEDNQQPSLDSNIFEGSTTNSRILTSKVEDSNANTSVLLLL